MGESPMYKNYILKQKCKSTSQHISITTDRREVLLMVTYQKLFSDSGCFIGFTVYVDGEHFETCEAEDLNEVVRRAKRQTSYY